MGVSKEKIQEMLAERYNAKDIHQVVVFGVRTAFGGGKSTAFGLVYDSLDSVERFEPCYRQIRLGLLEKGDRKRKQIKENKNKRKSSRGVKRDSSKKKHK